MKLLEFPEQVLRKNSLNVLRLVDLHVHVEYLHVHLESLGLPLHT